MSIKFRVPNFFSKTVLVSTDVVEKLLFSMFSSILAFDFDLSLGLFWFFGVTFGVVAGFKN